jgi:hypothetical protein
MIISDLTYLETVSEESSLHGGLFNFSSSQFNTGVLIQMATASAGNNSKIAIGNVALAINIGVPIQINL